MIKVGIFFGGMSREREVSFAGGRTIYDNLDKSLFEPVPIFVDSLGQFIHLDWQYIYKGTIRDFYPPAAFLPPSPNHFQIYVESLPFDTYTKEEVANSVGKLLQPTDFKDLFDIAFLALHGPYGEDGNIQGLLEWYGIPYTGCGILPSAIGINKAIQQDILKQAGFARPKQFIYRDDEEPENTNLFSRLKEDFGFPVVIKSPSQGSSIGVSIITESTTEQEFKESINRSLFEKIVYKHEYQQLIPEQKVAFVRQLTDIKEGIGLPLVARYPDQSIRHPEELIHFLDNFFADENPAGHKNQVFLQNPDGEEIVIIESFIKGREFSCIVIQDGEGEPVALPPTEIIKKTDLFDYKSKYLPGMSPARLRP